MELFWKEEHRLVRKMMREFTRREVAPFDAEMDESEQFPYPVIEKMVENGVFGASFPAEYGGGGLDALSESIVLEELARGSASVAITLDAHLVGVDPIFRYGSDRIRERYLADIITGRKICVFALTEPGCGSDAAGLQTTASPDGDGWLLNGHKAWITNYSVGGVYVVAARTDPSKGAKGISLFAVEKGAPGLTVGASEKKMGYRGSDTGSLSFSDCRVSRDSLIGEEGQGFRYAMEALDVGRISISAMGVGLMQRALDEASGYARERMAFGQRIGDFQSIQFMLADMDINLSAARTMLYATAMKRAAGQKYSLEAARLKALVSTAAVKATSDAVQIFGGNGYSREFAVERLMREAKLLEIGEGTTQILRMIVGRDVMNRSAE